MFEHLVEDYEPCCEHDGKMSDILSCSSKSNTPFESAGDGCPAVVLTSVKEASHSKKYLDQDNESYNSEDSKETHSVTMEMMTSKLSKGEMPETPLQIEEILTSKALHWMLQQCAPKRCTAL
eukprot:4655896-Ditylum_brightwellii.AAC.1